MTAKKPTGRNFYDLEGMKSGKLSVVSYAGKRKGKSYWICRCDCGSEKSICGYSLKSGRVSSCGCLKSELLAARCTTHGQSHSPVYRIWKKLHE